MVNRPTWRVLISGWARTCCVGG